MVREALERSAKPTHHCRTNHAPSTKPFDDPMIVVFFFWTETGQTNDWIRSLIAVSLVAAALTLDVIGKRLEIFKATFATTVFQGQHGRSQRNARVQFPNNRATTCGTAGIVSYSPHQEEPQRRQLSCSCSPFSFTATILVRQRTSGWWTVLAVGSHHLLLPLQVGFNC
jgi:hypothetical protein